MKFYAQNGGQRPSRLSEATRKFAYDSLGRKYGLDTLKTNAISLDDIEDFPALSKIEKYDIAIRRIAEEAPIRLCEGERLSGAFDGLGCPEIILVKKPETCEDGAVRYGDCFEIVLWKNGVNVWRHFRDEAGKCSWHKRLGLTVPMREGDIHELTVKTEPEYITFSVDGISAKLRVEDLFDTFYIGVTACEGIVRLYDFSTEE